MHLFFWNAEKQQLDKERLGCDRGELGDHGSRSLSRHSLLWPNMWKQKLRPTVSILFPPPASI